MKDTLLNAVGFREVNAVRDHIASGADLNYLDPTMGWTPLQAAVANDSIDSFVIAQILINADADLNIQNNLGYTPLHFAVSYCNINALQLLLDSGADIFIKDKENKTPLDLAIEYKNEKLIKFIQSYHDYQNLKNDLNKQENTSSSKKIKL